MLHTVGSKCTRIENALRRHGANTRRSSLYKTHYYFILYTWRPHFEWLLQWVRSYCVYTPHKLTRLARISGQCAHIGAINACVHKREHLSSQFRGPVVWKSRTGVIHDRNTRVERVLVVVLAFVGFLMHCWTWEKCCCSPHTNHFQHLLRTRVLYGIRPLPNARLVDFGLSLEVLRTRIHRYKYMIHIKYICTYTWYKYTYFCAGNAYVKLTLIALDTHFAGMRAAECRSFSQKILCTYVHDMHIHICIHIYIHRLVFEDTRVHLHLHTPYIYVLHVCAMHIWYMYTIYHIYHRSTCVSISTDLTSTYTARPRRQRQRVHLMSLTSCTCNEPAPAGIRGRHGECLHTTYINCMTRMTWCANILSPSKSG